MASRETAASKWQTAQPLVLTLVLGLIAGPYISNVLGWQVTSGAASARARADVVERLSSVCAAQARMEIPDPSKLDQSARASLAEKWAVMPGDISAAFDVTTACAGKLGRANY
jgi:hypothetical protein